MASNFGFVQPYMAVSPNYNPVTYGGEDMFNSDFVRSYIDPLVPKGLYERWLNTNGYGGASRRDQYLRNNYGRADQEYQAAVLSYPDLSFRDFLDGWAGLGNEWLAMSANQRGTALPTRSQVVRWG